MLELRSFLLAAAGTFGLLEVTNSELLLPPDSDPESLTIKAIITLMVGAFSTLLTRLIKKRSTQKGTRRRCMHKAATPKKVKPSTKKN